jgi:hypothetical protein
MVHGVILLRATLVGIAAAQRLCVRKHVVHCAETAQELERGARE